MEVRKFLNFIKRDHYLFVICHCHFLVREDFKGTIPALPELPTCAKHQLCNTYQTVELVGRYYVHPFRYNNSVSRTKLDLPSRSACIGELTRDKIFSRCFIAGWLQVSSKLKLVLLYFLFHL